MNRDHLVEQAAAVASHRVGKFFLSSIEELKEDFPQLDKEELMLILAKTFSTYTFSSFATLFQSNEIALLLSQKSSKEEYLNCTKRRPEWNQHSPNSEQHAILTDLRSKASSF